MYFDVSRGKLNGVFAYLYSKYSSSFSEIVKVTGSNIEPSSSFDPIGSVIPDSSKYFVDLGNYFYVNLTQHYVHIVQYSIKQNTDSRRVLTQWRFQGSLDGSSWKTLSEVEDCDDECKNEVIHSLPSKEGVFNSFRIIKNNKNSDNSSQFDVKKFELFGSLCNTKDCRVPIRKYNTRCICHNQNVFSIYIVIAIII